MSQGAHSEVQRKAKRVLSALGATIVDSDTEHTIAERTVTLLRAEGLVDTWYHACPALVLLGSRSALSISGRHYEPSHDPVGPSGLVTVDVSPCQGQIWADCARSYAIEGGRVTAHPRDPELAEGLKIERALHELLVSEATPDTTFGELHAVVSRNLSIWGWENLDFGANFGHSIATKAEDRVYIESGNDMSLGDVAYFTFEPHVRRRGGTWGFKHEDIYYFDSRGKACAL